MAASLVLLKKQKGDNREKVKFARDDHLGYITSCPTNLGTALRAWHQTTLTHQMSPTKMFSSKMFKAPTFEGDSPGTSRGSLRQESPESLRKRRKEAQRPRKGLGK